MKSSEITLESTEITLKSTEITLKSTEITLIQPILTCDDSGLLSVLQANITEHTHLTEQAQRLDRATQTSSY